MNLFTSTVNSTKDFNISSYKKHSMNLGKVQINQSPIDQDRSDSNIKRLYNIATTTEDTNEESNQQRFSRISKLVDMFFSESHKKIRSKNPFMECPSGDPVKNYLDIIEEKFDKHLDDNIKFSAIKSTFLVEHEKSKIIERKKSNLNNIIQRTKEQPKITGNDISDAINYINEPIDIKRITRPFSIILRGVELKNKIYNSAFDPKKEYFSVFCYKMQIFCGSQPFSKPRVIKWKGANGDENPFINRRIYFSLQYYKLPMFASIVFKVKLLKYNKNYDIINDETIAWANFRLFDHNRRLKTGIQKLSLWETKFSDDSYYCWIDNPEIKNCPHINFELESFVLPVKHTNEENTSNAYNPSIYMVNSTDQQKFVEISEKSPFDQLNNYDQDILWSNRYAITQIPSLIPKLLTNIDYKKENYMKELDKILKLSKSLKPVQALELLTGKFLHEDIRKLAVRSLQESSYIEIQDYIIQLVQALKYEMYHDSHLAQYLLKTAIKHPLTLGHYLFWNLRSETYNPIVQQRFGLYLEIFLQKIGGNLRQIFEDEVNLIKELLVVADIPLNKSLKSEKEKLAVYRQALTDLNNKIFGNGKEISMPINFKLRAKGFIVEKCRFMKSKKKPMWLVFENADPNGENIVVMFKKGDDLRQDILTLQLFKIMNILWYEERISLKMSLYNVISTGFFQGMLEIVKDSETLATIHKVSGGATATFSSKPLKNWLRKNATISESEVVNNFLLSSVAYSVSTFVLGIGDRHNDNIMVKRVNYLNNYLEWRIVSY
jgi:hypothetical protein